MTAVAAIDLGATSGRVIAGAVADGVLSLRHVARFANDPVRLPDGLHWDVLALFRGAMRGLGEASRTLDVTGAAVDAWAVDYGLLRGNRLLGNPYHYRDDRNALAVPRVHAVVPPEELYRGNGLQHLPFNTVFQLAAAAATGELDEADHLLLIPDLIGYWATGARVAERTNASTTGLLPVGASDWDVPLLSRLGLRRDLLAEVVEPGTELGGVLPAMGREFGVAPGVRFTTVGSHDTASAVVGVPMTEDGAVYISCGTWSLVGAELPRAIVSDEARAAGFTNEAGVDGTVRFLKNVMGLWLLTESIRDWEREGGPVELGPLLGQAAEARPDVPVFDASDPRLLAPGAMPERIEALLAERGDRVASRPEFVRSVLQSLADAYAAAIRDVERLTGVPATRVHLVGGGAQNALLCGLTADTVGLPVEAGPVEATAIGNLLVQARTHRLVDGDLAALRAVVARSFPTRTHAVRTTTRG